MDKFPKEILIEIALDLDMEHIIKFCKTNKRVNLAICENENFWRMKLIKDYPNHDSLSQIKENYRNKYRRINAFYQSIQETCQKFLNHFFGASQKYMDKLKYFADFRDAVIELRLLERYVVDDNYEEYSDRLYDYRKKYEFLFPGIVIHAYSDTITEKIYDSPDDPINFILENTNFRILSEFDF